MEVNSISIIGLGLIGGSLSKALRQKNKNLKIYAVDNNADSIELAQSEGTIDMGFSDCCSEVWTSDVIFVCTPVSRTIQYINQLSANVRESCIITDVASTKGEICDYIDSLEKPPIFIGGHPMAGTEKSGYKNALAHLFENAFYVLTPTKAVKECHIDTLKTLISGIGAMTIIVSAREHDLVTGCISHVPHIVASVLVTLAKSSENETGLVKLLAAGGFKDITRIASSNPGMWENIVLSNSSVIIDLLNDCKEITDKIIGSIKSHDNKAIYGFFENAKNFRDSFSNTSVGLFPKNFELLVDVPDKPGIIGSITTLLGNNQINIKNINVSNSREFEQGCLKITLSDQFNTDRAFEILSASSYKVFRND